MRSLSVDLDAQPLFQSVPPARNAAVIRASRRENREVGSVQGSLEAFNGLAAVYAIRKISKTTELVFVLVCLSVFQLNDK